MTFFACRAVLFDCDGVLVDSDASVMSAWSRWAVDRGLDPSEVTALVHGRRAADTVSILVAEAGRADALRHIDRSEVEDAQAVRAIPGAAELFSAIPVDLRAVVTSGTQVLARARLSAAGLPMPLVLITADDVIKGKPDPEGYRRAAQRLGVDPADAIVLEDAVAGVEAARAAGVGVVIGVGDRGLDAVTDLVVGDLTELRWTGNGIGVVAGPGGDR